MGITCTKNYGKKIEFFIFGSFQHAVTFWRIILFKYLLHEKIQVDQQIRYNVYIAWKGEQLSSYNVLSFDFFDKHSV